MCDTPFKTPRSHYLCKKQENGLTTSDESTTSSNGEISLIAEFDDLQRYYRCLKEDKIQLEDTLLKLTEEATALVRVHEATAQEVMRLRQLVDSKTQECTDLDHKLVKARKLIDKEKSNMKTNYSSLLKERDCLLKQLNQVKEVFHDRNNQHFAPETRYKLSFLEDYRPEARRTGFDEPCNNQHIRNLSAIKEINSTGSILSDFSYSRSEDDLDDWILHNGKTGRKHRPSTDGIADSSAPKKRRTSEQRKSIQINGEDTVRATTTLTVNKDGGPILATSVIESIPKGGPLSPKVETPKAANLHSPLLSAPPPSLVFESWAKSSPLRSDRTVNSRPHTFQPRLMVIRDTCNVCEKRIGFRNTAMKCTECKASCHVECKDKLPLPCIPTNCTPNQRKNLGLISDFTPTTPPMVPAILIHCINEIELRGLQEIGLYRIPGAEREVKALKERFLKGRGAPPLNQIEIHVICGCVKDFLRSLKEPLVTYRLRKEFVQAVEAQSEDIRPLIYQIISELPQPNRDTLAYIILHLQRVAQAKDCKMNISNLAMIFGPNVVGYTSDDPHPSSIIHEVSQQKKVMENLLEIPSDYWSTFIDLPASVAGTFRMQQTPSTDSLLRPVTTKSFFTPNKTLVKRKQKYFPSPK